MGHGVVHLGVEGDRVGVDALEALATQRVEHQRARLGQGDRLLGDLAAGGEVRLGEVERVEHGEQARHEVAAARDAASSEARATRLR